MYACRNNRTVHVLDPVPPLMHVPCCNEFQSSRLTMRPFPDHDLYACRKERALHVLGLVPPLMHSQLLQKIQQLKQIYSSALTNPDVNIQLAGLRATGSYLQYCERARDMRELQPLLSQVTLQRCIDNTCIFPCHFCLRL